MSITATVLSSEGHVLDATVDISSRNWSAGTRLDLTVSLDHDRAVDRVRARIAGAAVGVTEVLEHGFQSWSTVRRARLDDLRPERAHAPRWFLHQMLADGSSAGQQIAGDTFLVHDRGVIGALGAKNQFTRFYIDGNDLVAEWLLDEVRLGDARSITLEAVWYAQGEPGALYGLYADLAGGEMRARDPRPLRSAWCSWYDYFGAITPNDIRENLTLAREHDITVVQIDDGWQEEIGRWTSVNDNWGEDLSVIARDITSAGGVAGIWTAPFLAQLGGSLATEHPDWLLRHPDDRPVTALTHGGWGGNIGALDTTRPEVLEYLADTFRTLLSQGFRYFKIDFCHAASSPGIRFDPSVTRAQALRRGLEAIRSAIGEESYLVACGCPLLSAVGIVDAMRVSEDVAPFYQPRQFFDGWRECSVAARNAIEPSILRAPLHGRWFTLDPDCVLLRPVHTDLTASQRRLVLDVALATSGFVVLSDRLAHYGEHEWNLAQNAFTSSHAGIRELIDPFSPTVELRGPAGTFRVNWEHGQGTFTS